MTLTTMIIANVVLDVGLLAVLAFVMTRARRLDPHRARDGYVPDHIPVNWRREGRHARALQDYEQAGELEEERVLVTR